MNHLTFDATAQNFNDEVLSSDVPVLVEFTADWCPPCKMLAPIIKEIASKYEGKLRVGLLDSDDHPNIAQQYGVMGLPTMILFLNGSPVERLVGFMPGERIEGKLLPHLTVQNT